MQLSSWCPEKMAPNFSDVTFSPKAVMLANPLQAGIGLQAYHLSAAMLVLVRVFVLVIVLVLVMHLVLANLLQAGTGSHLSAGRGQLRARLTSQLGVTARWPHPSTAPSLPLSPKLGPEPIIRTKKTLLHPSSSAQSNFTTQIILFSRRKLFHNSLLASLVSLFAARTVSIKI